MGSFVIAFLGDISLTVEKVSKGIMSSAASMEGYVNIYKGTATLWISMKEAGCIYYIRFLVKKLMSS